MRAGFALARVLRLAIDQGDALFRQIERRHQQRIVAGILRIGGQKAENIVHRARDLRIRREQTQVGINSRRGRVVVSGADVRVTARHAVRIAAHQQRQLAVRLQTHQAVENLHSGIFQIARPADVRGLIEARLQLHHRRHFLARRSVHQRRDNQRMFAGAVESLLDGKNVLVFGRRLDKRNHRVVRIERMMQQDVVPAQLLEQILRFRGQAATRAAKTGDTSDPDASPARRH